MLGVGVMSPVLLADDVLRRSLYTFACAMFDLSVSDSGPPAMLTPPFAINAALAATEMSGLPAFATGMTAMSDESGGKRVHG